MPEGPSKSWPIDHYGALETGVHRFYARLPGKPEELTETGNFMIQWKQVDGKWLMAERASAMANSPSQTLPSPAKTPFFLDN